MPYAIPDSGHSFKENEDIIQISSFHDNFKIGSEFPKTMERVR